jgi:DNA-binding GntR family transcriptional regulator
MIGLAARLCLEIGLHRHTTIKKVFANHEDRKTALNVFWSVYMLERRICLGQGIPYSIQDSYVDQSLFLQVGGAKIKKESLFTDGSLG